MQNFHCFFFLVFIFILKLKLLLPKKIRSNNICKIFERQNGSKHLVYSISFSKIQKLPDEFD